MRSSDWSSDVCSSDLTIGEQVDDRDAQRELSTSARGEGGLEVDGATGAGESIHLGPHALAIGGDDGVERRPAEGALEGQAAQAGEGPVCAPDRARGAEGPRQEEGRGREEGGNKGDE